MTAFTDTAFLTKIIVNPAHRDVRQDLRDVQRMHHTLTTLACRPDFGPASRSAAGLLYRIETTAVGVHILMQSTTCPDSDRLAPGYSIAGSRGVGPLLDQLDTGTSVRYRITANPTKSAFTRRERGKREGLAGTAAVEWWQRKANVCGLDLTHVETTGTAHLTGTRGKGRIHLAATTFEGTATIADVKAIRDSILTGIGRGRAYGCGLLSIAPTR